MGEKTLAALLVEPYKLEFEEFSLPPIGHDDGLIRVEACGLCGTDVSVFQGRLAQRYPLPLIPGHEVVGTIEKLGRKASQRWNVEEGDRVAIEPLLHCGCCESCLSGWNVCTNNSQASPMPYGLIRKDIPPGIWGGYSQYMYLHPNTLLHRVPDGISPRLAALFNPLGSGVKWAVSIPNLGLGDTIVIIGAGQRGVSSVIAAMAAGAAKVIAVEPSRNHKLNLAAELGAVTVESEHEDLLQRISEETGGRMADVVMDLTPKATQPVLEAIEAVRTGGTIILAGGKGDGNTVPIPTDRIYLKNLTIKGAFGADYPSFKKAIRIIASGRFPLERMMTHSFPLREAETAIRTLAGEISGEAPICVAIEPWLDAIAD